MVRHAFSTAGTLKDSTKECTYKSALTVTVHGGHELSLYN